tara:strand:+ start:362 stop:562 length:201 start_codon:yes stop_codon:yes gene_type:complete
MKFPFEIRMAILIFVGGCVPVLITQFYMWFFECGFEKAVAYTFATCIPIAAWMASKINERWHDDRE